MTRYLCSIVLVLAACNTQADNDPPDRPDREGSGEIVRACFTLDGSDAQTPAPQGQVIVWALNSGPDGDTRLDGSEEGPHDDLVSYWPEGTWMVLNNVNGSDRYCGDLPFEVWDGDQIELQGRYIVGGFTYYLVQNAGPDIANHFMDGSVQLNDRVQTDARNVMNPEGNGPNLGFTADLN